jgi:hypothetical protein
MPLFSSGRWDQWEGRARKSIGASCVTGVGLGPPQDAYTVALLLADPAALLGLTADESFGYRQADAA